MQKRSLSHPLTALQWWCLPDSPKPVSPKPVSPKLGFRVRVRVNVSANRVSANRDWTAVMLLFRILRYKRIGVTSLTSGSRDVIGHVTVW